MRFAPALLGVLLATGCSAATAAPPVPTAATVAQESPLLASEGGVLRPIDNGGRVGMRSGYATVRLTPSPQDMDPLLQVSLFDRAGQPVAADVSVDYESMDMDHGINVAKGVPHDGGYRVGLSFAMAGPWRLVIHVTRDGADEKVILVLPWVGL